jgi:aspartate aminotransferase
MPVSDNVRHSMAQGSWIRVTSYSKDLAKPGERIGYIAVHPDCHAKQELVTGFVFCDRVLGM